MAMIGGCSRHVVRQVRAISRRARGIADAVSAAMKTLDRAQLAKILGGAGNSPTSTPNPHDADAIAASRILPRAALLPRF